jgi:hypothetical protein
MNTEASLNNQQLHGEVVNRGSYTGLLYVVVKRGGGWTEMLKYPGYWEK